MSSRPDFVALISPWPAKKPTTAYPILPNPPPVFIASAEDDPVAPPQFAREIGEEGGGHESVGSIGGCRRARGIMFRQMGRAARTCAGQTEAKRFKLNQNEWLVY